MPENRRRRPCQQRTALISTILIPHAVRPKAKPESTSSKSSVGRTTVTGSCVHQPRSLKFSGYFASQFSRAAFPFSRLEDASRFADSGNAASRVFLAFAFLIRDDATSEVGS